MKEPKFKVGQLVMYKGRTNPTSNGMPVQQVDANMFDAKYMVDYKWWNEGNLQTFEDWKDRLK